MSRERAAFIAHVIAFDAIDVIRDVGVQHVVERALARWASTLRAGEWIDIVEDELSRQQQMQTAVETAWDAS